MAEVAQKRAEHAEVRKPADDIISAQEGQISVMKRIGDDMRGMGMGHGGHMGMSRSEMGMDMDLPMLRRTKSFDRAFIDMMLPHHQGAIAMARKGARQGQPAGAAHDRPGHHRRADQGTRADAQVAQGLVATDRHVVLCRLHELAEKEDVGLIVVGSSTRAAPDVCCPAAPPSGCCTGRPAR